VCSHLTFSCVHTLNLQRVLIKDYKSFPIPLGSEGEEYMSLFPKKEIPPRPKPQLQKPIEGQKFYL